MALNRHRLLTSLAIGICGAVLFIAPHPANAQITASGSGVVTPPALSAADAEALRQRILRVIGDATEVTQSTPTTCTGYSHLFGQLSNATSPGNNILCGERAAQDGAIGFSPPLPYSAGDIIKCRLVVAGQNLCAVTRASNGNTLYYASNALGTHQQAEFDAQGKYLPETSNTDSPIAGEAAAAASGLTGAAHAVGSAAECVSGLTNLGGCILSAVAAGILTFANFLLGMSGVLLNLIVFYGVFQFGNTIGNAPGVLIAWGILRDIANMALLFGFIFMGVATILDTSAIQRFTAKNALPPLIIFAVLMNFSLFTAEALIDVSNALSSSIYAQANTDPCLLEAARTVTATSQTQCGLNYGLAGHIMQSTGLSSVFATHGDQSLSVTATGYLGLALFATIGALVFFAASIMLALRLVVLTFLMVVSPIGFAGMAIPPLQKLAGDWWQRVIHQAFYAPIFLLLVLISLKISDSFTTTQTNTGLLAAVSDPNASVMSVVLVFMLVCGFLLASLIIANKFGASGASFAVRSAGRMTYGALGYVGRNTAGRSFYNINERIRKSPLGQTRVGRRMALLAEKGSKASYDLRGTKAAGLVGKQIGDLGKPVNDGYAGAIKERTTAYSNYAKTLKQTKAAEAREKQLKNQKDSIAERRQVENERWDKEKQDREQEIEQLKKDIAAREKERDAQNARVNAAITSGNKDAYRREKNSLDALTNQHVELNAVANTKLQQRTSDLEKAREQHKTFIKGFDDELVNINKELKGDIDKGEAGVDADSSKRAFAINLKNSRIPGGAIARKKAADAIKLELSKSKTQKALDALKDSIDANKDDTGAKLEEVKGEIKAESDKSHEGSGEGGHH